MFLRASDYSLLCALSFAVRLITAQAEPNVHIRTRGASTRAHTTETRIRTINRMSRQDGTPPARGCCSRVIEIITATLVRASTYSIWERVALCGYTKGFYKL